MNKEEIKTTEDTKSINEDLESSTTKGIVLKTVCEDMLINTNNSDFISCTNSIQSAINSTARALGNMFISGIASYGCNLGQTISNLFSEYDFSDLAASMAKIAVESMSPIFESYARIFEMIDFLPLRRFTEEMNRLGYIIQYNQYAKVYCAVMYNAEWFPYLDVENEHKLFLKLNEIIATSRPGSQRQINRINRAVLDYYTDAKVKKIRNGWKTINIESHYKKMISQAVDAYFRKEYILTISCLAPLWETFIFKNESKERRCGPVVIKKFNEMTENSNDNNITEWLTDFFSTLIMGQCNELEEVKDDLPNRNGISHGWWNKYPSKKSALNAILLTDFILNL